MMLKIGKTIDNTMKVNKSFSEVIAENVNIEPTSIVNKLNPVFIVAYDNRYLDANYVYCSELDRYYFCVPSINTGGRVVLTCNIDFLSGVDLSNCDITVLRNEGIGKPTEIPDNKLPVKPSSENVKQIIVENESFNDLINPYPYVIQITGG